MFIITNVSTIKPYLHVYTFATSCKSKIISTNSAAHAFDVIFIHHYYHLHLYKKKRLNMHSIDNHKFKKLGDLNTYL